MKQTVKNPYEILRIYPLYNVKGGAPRIGK
jgi:hypothetical protein